MLGHFNQRMKRCKHFLFCLLHGELHTSRAISNAGHAATLGNVYQKENLRRRNGALLSGGFELDRDESTARQHANAVTDARALAGICVPAATNHAAGIHLADICPAGFEERIHRAPDGSLWVFTLRRIANGSAK